MLPIVFAALMYTTTADNTLSVESQVWVEQCGRRLVTDTDLDLGRQLLFVQDVETDAILYSEEVDAHVLMRDRADELDVCSLPS